MVTELTDAKIILSKPEKKAKEVVGADTIDPAENPDLPTVNSPIVVYSAVKPLAPGCPAWIFIGGKYYKI